jgi:hypothetical protein
MVTLLVINALLFTVNVQPAKSSALLTVAGASIPGDLDGNNMVDIFDVIILAKSYMATPDKSNWNANADINKDGIVDVYDAMILSTHFGEHSEQSLKIGMYVASWNFDEFTVETIASTFDMSQSWCVSAGDAYVAKMNQVHALNPGYKALVYRSIKDIYDYWTDEWNYANQSGWLLKDASGNYLVSINYGHNYLVDITNPDYQKWVAQIIKSWIENYSFDGVFADNSLFSDAGEWLWDSNARPINPRTNTYFSDEEVRQGLIQIHKEIRNAIGNKLLICNGIYHGSRFYERQSSYMEILNNSPLDGIMSEGCWYDGVNHIWKTEDQWLDSLRFLRWFQDSDRYFVAAGYSVGQLPQDCTSLRMAMYAYASTLLGITRGKTYLFCGFDYDGWSKDGLINHPDVMSLMQGLNNLTIGVPLEEYHIVTGTHVYERDFSNAKVLVNPTNTSYTVSLSQSYKTLDGSTVSGSLTVGTYTGFFLLK